jgi:hypothetical protein
MAGGDEVWIDHIEVAIRFGKHGIVMTLADDELADAIDQQILRDAKT